MPIRVKDNSWLQRSVEIANVKAASLWVLEQLHARHARVMESLPPTQ